MNAMLEPKMVAASIQVLAPAPQGTSTAADLITSSSQGVLMGAKMPFKTSVALKIGQSLGQPASLSHEMIWLSQLTCSAGLVPPWRRLLQVR
jgi:hypothetical protein